MEAQAMAQFTCVDCNRQSINTTLFYSNPTNKKGNWWGQLPFKLIVQINYLPNIGTMYGRSQVNHPHSGSITKLWDKTRSTIEY